VCHVRFKLCQASVISWACGCRQRLAPVPGIAVAGNSSSAFAPYLVSTWATLTENVRYNVSSKRVFTATLEMSDFNRN
jgi:hypothetical protein